MGRSSPGGVEPSAMMTGQTQGDTGVFANAIAWLADAEVVTERVARRRRILVHANLVIIASLTFFAVRRAVMAGIDASTLVLAATGLILTGSLATIRLLGRHLPALVITLATTVLAVSHVAHINGGLSAPAAVAFVAAPLLAVFVGGRRSGLATFVATLVALVAVYAFSQPIAASSYVDTTRLLTLLGTVAFTYAVAVFFEEERSRTAAKMARSREDFRRLVDRARDAIVVVRDGTIVYANAATVDLFGFSHDETLDGRPLASVIHSDDRDDMAPVLQRLLRGDTSDETSEASFRRPDGERVTIVIRQVEDVHFGGNEGLLLIARDIREKKRLEAQLRMADRLASVGSLAAGVAHEVNNPLTYVMNNLSYAADCSRAVRHGAPTSELEDALEALDEALDGAKRVQRIVSDLQSFSRESTPEQSRVDLRQVLSSALKMANHEVKHRATLEEDHEEDLPFVWGDEPKLAQLFLNLVINAAQAIPIGDKCAHNITVRTRRIGTVETPRILIEVVDSGGGIDEAVLDRIFDPFFTTKPVGEGTGLGLAISHGLVTSMGGSLTLRNNPDRGVTARVELPAMAAQPDDPRFSLTPLVALAKPRILAAAQHTETLDIDSPALDLDAMETVDTTPPDSSEKPRILVVDDEPYVGQAIRRMLRPTFEVEVVRRGVDALERLTIDHYAAVLCDVMMPQMSGMDLHAEVARMLPGDEDRLIFMTGGAFTPEARAFLALLEKDGRTRSLLKPFDRDAVMAAIEQCRMDRIEHASSHVELGPDGCSRPSSIAPTKAGRSVA